MSLWAVALNLSQNAMDGSVYSTRGILASLVIIVSICFNNLSYFDREVSKERMEGVGGREGGREGRLITHVTLSSHDFISPW